MKNRSTTNDRKALQLCSQIRWALDCCINDALEDNESVMVAEVIAAGTTSHLLVICEPLEEIDLVTMNSIERKLQANAGALRSVAAGAISRRKTPNLSFRVRPSLNQRPASTRPDN